MRAFFVLLACFACAGVYADTTSPRFVVKTVKIKPKNATVKPQDAGKEDAGKAAAIETVPAKCKCGGSGGDACTCAGGCKCDTCPCGGLRGDACTCGDVCKCGSKTDQVPEAHRQEHTNDTWRAHVAELEQKENEAKAVRAAIDDRLAVDGVCWDESFLVESLKPVVGAAAEKERVYLYMAPWCKACPKTEAAMGAGNDRVQIIPKHTEVQGAKFYPAYWHPRTQQFFYNYRLDANGNPTIPWIDNSLENLELEVERHSPMASFGIPAGEVERDVVERFLAVLAISPSVALENKEYDYKWGSVTFRLPANFKAMHSTKDKTTRITFNSPPRMIWGYVDKQLDAIVYNGEDQIDFEIPKIPNPYLRVKGQKKMESYLPDTPLASRMEDDVLPKEIPSTRQTVAQTVSRSQVLDGISHVGNWTYPGQQSKAGLIHHLLTASEHAGDFTEEELWAMDYGHLMQIHSKDHTYPNGATITVRKAQPVRRDVMQSRGYCPTCPSRRG